jgi:hypothetical protein
MNQMDKLLSLIFFFILTIGYSYAQQCTRSGGGDIYYKDQDGNLITKYLPGGNRGQPTAQWIAKCAPKVVELAENQAKNEPTNEQCSACKANHNGPARRAICGNTLGCSFIQLAFLTIEKLTIDSSPIISACSGAMACSEETQLCEFICPENFNYNFSTGFCEQPCRENEVLQGSSCVACPSGKIAVNNVCTSDICAHLGSGFRPYNGQCLAVTDRTSYMSPPLNSNGFRVDLDSMSKNTNMVATVSYAGCSYENGQSKALLQISSDRSPTYKYNSYSFPLYTYCADGTASTSNYGLTDKKLGNIPTYVANSEYISVPANNICYKYRSVILDGFSITDLGVTDIPYVDCSDCAPGAIKINGECTCPAGQNMTANGCKADIGCKTSSDFANGLCQCGGGNVYSHAGLNGTKYTCTNPTYSRFDEAGISKGNLVSVSVSQAGCSGNNYTFNWSASSTSSYPVNLYYVCTDKSFLELNPNVYSFAGFGGASVGSGTLGGNQSSSGTFNISVDGSCYNYKLVAKDTWTWMGSAEFSVNYSSCGP